ncbi:DNA internalization-related competence protein ComEC/Rec2 [Panacagrimonas sp.]|uniref:DNA internalization-related competence protein ComEC/Rec2 n=1 Tax=Panacagrimonas sp. TaxID=2480088 RepID=UPI003B52A80D
MENEIPARQTGLHRAGQDLRVLAAALATGVLGVHAMPALPPPSALLLLALPALLPWRGRSIWGAATLGVLCATWTGQRYLEQRWPAPMHGSQMTVPGHIVSLPERVPGGIAGEPSAQRFEFRPLDESLPQKIRASWYRGAQAVRGGECWTLQLRLRTPRGSFNPGTFDYEGWLYRNGVTAVATVRSGRRCEQLRWLPILRARQALMDRYDLWLADHPGKAMVAALSVGEDAGFSDRDWEVFRRTGTSHLVAISGFNVAILAGLAFLVLRWTWPLSRRLSARLPAQKAAMIGAALAGLAYGLLAGWESPAQRAALMLALLLLAAMPDRRGAPSRVLALALMLMLLAAPAAVLSPGLWLSFGAVAAIFYCVTGRLATAPVWRSALSLQLMLSVLLAPLTLYFFQGAAWLGLPVNLVAVPVMTVLTPLVIAAIGVALAIPDLGVPLLGWIAELLHWLQLGLAWIAQHAPAAWIPASPPASALLLALFGGLLIFAPRGVPLRALGALCLVPLLWPPRVDVRPPFELVALDVGQGLSVLVRTSNHALLYDAGPAFPGGFDAGASVVVPYVLRQGLGRIDQLLLSHGDRDHAGGVAAVRAKLPIGAERGTVPDNACSDGQAWEWDGVAFEVLHPNEQQWSSNNRSCVLRIMAPGMTVLLAGDIERAAEARLLRDHGDRLKADILVVPHHGSRTSSTPAFVNAVAPAVAIFGAAWRSHYGHPHPQVHSRYRALNADLRVTGVDGAVSVWREPQGLRLRSWRLQAPRFWSAPAQP